MTPPLKARYGSEAVRNAKWTMAATSDPPLKRPSGAPQPWLICHHPAERAHRSHIPPRHPHLPLFHTRHAEESAERPHLVTIVRPSGQSELRKVTVLLNRRGVVSFEQLLLDISEALGFPRWHRGRVTRLYTTHAREVKGVCDFFRGEAAFLALGKVRPELSSVQDALEELFPEHSHYRANVLRAWEKKLRPVPNKAAKADSGYSEGTESGGTNQKTCRDTSPNVMNHDNAPVSQHKDTHQQENYNPDHQKSYKKNYCRKPAHLPNNLQKLRMRGGVKEQQPSITDPLKHSGGLKDTEIPSPVLCENCLARRVKPLGSEQISTLSGRVPLPPVLKKAKESAQQEVKRSGVLVNPSLPQPMRRNGEKNLIQLQPLNPAPDVGITHTDTWNTETGVPPTHGSNLTLSDIERSYEIGRVIGDGNFAVVRECRRRDNGHTFAMKIVERSKLIGREHMMQNELSLLGSLCHPRIVRLLAHHHTHTHSYLVMELVSGGDLFEAIRERGKFSEVEAGLMVSDVSDALNYIHCRSIIHRDLKPENLLIEKITAAICRLKLGDFGLAMVVTEPVFTICGTPTYVAPEILLETGYGVAVDVWAVGVILYILLCGFAPFRSRDRDQEELFKLIKQAQLLFPSPYWDSISEEAKSLVRSLLQPDPAVRLTAEQTLQHKWVKTMASICRQRALTDKTQRNAADATTELQRVQKLAQRNAAESLTDKTAGRCGSKDKITLRRNDEFTARGRDETKPVPPQLKGTGTVNATASQNKEQTPLVGKGSQENLNLPSGEQHKIQDPGPKLPKADHGDLIQHGFFATQTEFSLLESKPNSKQESPPDSPSSYKTSVPNHSRSLSSAPPIVQTNCDLVSPSPTLQQPPSNNTQLRTVTRRTLTTPSPKRAVSPDNFV